MILKHCLVEDQHYQMEKMMMVTVAGEGISKAMGRNNG